VNLDSLIEDLKNHYKLTYFEYQVQELKDLPLSVRLDAYLGDLRVSSWGSAFNLDLAFTKALMELVERLTLIQKNSNKFYKKSFFREVSVDLDQIADMSSCSVEYFIPKNSNGVAVHTSRKNAQMSAYFELVERHVVLSCLVFNITPKQVYPKFVQPSLPDNYKMEFFYWRFQDCHVVVSILILPNGGYYFGFGCRRKLIEACRKAFDELTPLIAYSFHDTEDIKQGHQIIKDDIYSFGRYWRFSGDQRAYAFLNGFISEEKWNEIPALIDILFADVPFPDTIKSSASELSCIRCVSPQAQQLFFDDWDFKYINPLYRKNLVKLPKFPHFIA